MRVRKLFILFAALACVIIFVIYKLRQSSSSSQSVTTINFFNQKPEVAAGYQKLAKLYEKEHPNVKVKITTVGNGSGASSLQAKFVSGDAPDVVMLGGLPDVDRYRKHLISLNSMSIQKKIVPSLKTGAEIGSTLYGIPVDIEGYGWSYNKQIFKKAGIDPNSIHNYATFKKAVEKLNSEKKKLGLTAVFGFNGGDTTTIASYAAQFLSQHFKNNLTKAYYSEHLNWKYSKQMRAYTNLIKKYNVQPILSVKYDPSVQDLFFNEKVAMIPQGNWIIPTLDEADSSFVKDKLGMLPFYVGNNKQIMTGSSWYIGITDQHPAKEKAAKKFVTWLYTSPESQNITVNEMRLVPATINYPLSKLPDPISKLVYVDGTSKNAFVPVHKEFPNGFTQEAIGPNMQRYFANRITWKEFQKLTSRQYYQLRQVQGGK
ncbi:extracellular solute-binding protein [Oenococcus oeni]